MNTNSFFSSLPNYLTQVNIGIGQEAVTQKIPGAEDGWKTGGFALFGKLIGNVMGIFLTIGAIAVLFFLIWGAIDWITAGGDKGKLDKAREKITQAIIGLILLISTGAIMLFVQNLLGICIIDLNGDGCKAGQASTPPPTAPGDAICTSVSGRYCAPSPADCSGVVVAGKCPGIGVCCRQ